MKKILALIAALVAVQGLWAQSNIENVLSSTIDKYQNSNLQENHSQKTDPDGKTVTSSTDIYTFSSAQNADVDNFIKAFKKDSHDAYYYIKGNKGDRSILLGDNVIGQDYDWHQVLCFSDGDNQDYRYGYSLEWNDRDNNFRVIREYGMRPARQDLDFSSLGSFFKSLSDAMSEAGKALGMAGQTTADAFDNMDWDKISDSVAMSMRRIDWNQISDSVAKSIREANDSLSSAMAHVDWNKIRDSVAEEMNEFDWHQISDSLANDIRRGSEKLQKELNDGRSDFSKPRREMSWTERFDRTIRLASPNSADDISKIYDLCKNRPENLSEADRDSCISSIKDLRKRTDDRMLRKMLSASIKCLKQ